jgi:hypothetical protein
MRTHLILASYASATLLDPAMTVAQDLGDIAHGRKIARTICAACLS